MHRSLLLVTIVVSLAAAAGCGARAGRHSAVPGSSVAEISSTDPSWSPPGEMDLSIGDGRSEGARKESRASTQMKPNASKRPTRGAVHAAVY